jgi:leucine dehydrogenase
LINVYSELNGYDRSKALTQTEHIYNATMDILKNAQAQGIHTQLAAMQIAEKRIYNK